MGTVVESQILKETEKCHILHFKTDKEWHHRLALLETVLNNRETQMKTMPGASSVLPISISLLSGPNIPSVAHFIPFLNPPFFWSSSCPRPGTWSPFQLLLRLSPSPAPGAPPSSLFISHNSPIACRLHSFLCRECSPKSWCGRLLFVLRF